MMPATPYQSVASTYEGIVRGRATRVRDWAGAVWADKERLRRIAMIWGVAAVAAVALVLWLTSGRYAGTDDAYVEAAKLMVTTDVSGLVKTVDVRSGQHVKKGQVLFTLDARPFEIAAANTRVLNVCAMLGFRFSNPESAFHWHAPHAPHLLPAAFISAEKEQL